jgi:hypothetical protein
MSTDRDLLELAAKAAGLTWSKSKDITHDGLWIIKPSVKTYWNPLTDDGDALRLAVKLGLLVDVCEEATGAQALNVAFCTEAINNDPCAATRRAITRAAAAIGEAMP